MAENERDIVYSESVKAGKRIYYFDVKETRNGEKFLTITESKKQVEGDEANPLVTFKKHKIFLYKEDYDKFLSALQKTVNVAKDGISDSPLADSQQTTDDAGSSSLSIDIDW